MQGMLFVISNSNKDVIHVEKSETETAFADKIKENNEA